MAGSLLRRWLLVFAKEPAPGRVKTRLGRALGMQVAASLAKALLEDTLCLARRAADASGATLRVVHDPDPPGPLLRAALARFGAEPWPQGSGHLGERLARGFGEVEGARIALGMDAPDLPPTVVPEAFEHLERERAVLGPCPDGGYYLLGLGPAVDPACLTAGVRWSSAHTLDDTVAVLGACARLTPHRDVDDLDDLRALADRLRADPSSAPATAAWIGEHRGVLE